MKKILATSEKEIKQLIFPTMSVASEKMGVEMRKISKAIHSGEVVPECGYFFDELFDIDALCEARQEELNEKRRLANAEETV